ncbi:MAG: hypothetical protein KY460_08295 [Actinobacteria bacterium]|nr:hypothetical protein [Actinomycetota bacterium]
MRTTILLALLLVVGACASSPAAVTTATPTPSDAAVTAPAPQRLTGVLDGDPRLEGGCVWLETADRDRVEVIWPDGYEASADPVELRDAGGTVIATDGDEVMITGGPASDAVSVCQVGEIWRAATAAGPSGP